MIIQVNNYYEYGSIDLDDPSIVRLSIIFCTAKKAEEFAAKFPGYCKVKVSSIINSEHGCAIICFKIQVDTDKRTGEENETALKRKKKIFEILKKILDN